MPKSRNWKRRKHTSSLFQNPSGHAGTTFALPETIVARPAAFQYSISMEPIHDHANSDAAQSSARTCVAKWIGNLHWRTTRLTGVGAATLMLLPFITNGARANSSDETVFKGIALYRSGKYAAASYRFLDASEASNASDSVKATALYYLASCYYQLHRLSEAERLYDKLLFEHPKSPEARIAYPILKRLRPTWRPQVVAARSKPPSTGSGGVTTYSTGKPTQSPLTMAPTPSTLHADSNPRYEDEYEALPLETVIPFERGEQGHMLIDIYVEGRKIKVCFDTGGQAHFGLNHLAEAKIPLPTGKMTSETRGWAGVKVPTYIMPVTMRIGNMTRRINITVEKEGSVMPLVGQTFLRDLDYDVDNVHNTLKLRKRKKGVAIAAKQDDYEIPFTRETTAPWVIAQVNGQNFKVFIDTGATRTVFSEQAAKQLGIKISDEATTVEYGGVGGKVPMKEATADIKIGPIYRHNFNFLVGGELGCAVGQDFLEKWRFTIDQHKSTVKFYR